MDHLPLQVAVIHHIEIHDAEAADTSCRQIQQQRRAQTTGADTQHRGPLEPLLALHPHFRQDQMPREAGDFVGTELDAADIRGKHGGGSQALEQPSGSSTFPNARHR